MDGSTLNPADLLGTTDSNRPSSARASTPRGIKRSRSPDEGELLEDGTNLANGESDETKPRKRGRPAKNKSSTALNDSPSRPSQSATPAAQTPQPTPKHEKIASPAQASPARNAGNHKAGKAVTTTRDITAENLTEGGNEYEEIVFDDDGEQKVTKTGHLTGGRKYRCRTFFVPERGDTLFMLATECARVLQYRDSYLLFNKNRSLNKIIANHDEKAKLISEDILPYAYRSRQIAIVTARSMYRQFGARMIVDGRRVKDDYFEAKAREKGYTEEEFATERKPAPPPPKKETVVEQPVIQGIAHEILANNTVVYKDVPAMYSIDDLYGSPNFGIAPHGDSVVVTEDMQPRYYPNVNRPRQDMSGTLYQDRTTSSSSNDIINQASQAADLNRTIIQQARARGKFLEEVWNREHKIESRPETENSQPALDGQPLGQDRRISASQMLPPGQGPMSPQAAMHAPGMPMPGNPRNPMSASQAQSMMAAQQHRQAQAQAASMIPQTPNQQNPMASPVRGHHPGASLQTPNMHQRHPSHPFGNAQGPAPGGMMPNFNQPSPMNPYFQQQQQQHQQAQQHQHQQQVQQHQNQMWHQAQVHQQQNQQNQPQPSPSPMAQHHPQHPSMSPFPHGPQQSPHPHTQPSPHMHPQQSPTHPQMHGNPQGGHSSMNQGGAPGSMGGFGGMGMPAQAYQQMQNQRQGMFGQTPMGMGGAQGSPTHGPSGFMNQAGGQGMGGWPGMSGDGSAFGY